MDEESILKSLTLNGDGILQTLDGLSLCGKIFFYSCDHLFEKPLGLDPNKHKNTLNTNFVFEIWLKDTLRLSWWWWIRPNT